MYDTTTGWALYSSGFIHPENSQVLRTTTRIEIWNDVTPSIIDNNSVARSEFFIDQNLAIAVTTRTHLPESQETDVITWRTDDGGASWEPGEQFTTSVPEFIPDQLFSLMHSMDICWDKAI